MYFRALTEFIFLDIGLWTKSYGYLVILYRLQMSMKIIKM